MNTKDSDIVEMVAQWIEKTGFHGELSGITAGLHDIHDSVSTIFSNLLPSLNNLDSAQREAALEIIIDLLVEFDHIREHADIAANTLREVRDYLDTSSISASTDT